MLYELGNGTTVRIPDEIFFKLTDEEFKDFLTHASGYEIQDPFYDSILEEGMIDLTTPDIEEIEELPDGFCEEE